MNLLVNNETNECVELLINTIPASHFIKFIDCVNRKERCVSELCWCFLEKSDDNKEYYYFETFEDETCTLFYDDFVSIVKLAIIRYYIGTDDAKIKAELKEHIKNTVFDSILDSIDPSLTSGVPLIYG